MKKFKLPVMFLTLLLILTLVSCFTDSKDKDDDKATLYVCNVSGGSLYNFSIDGTVYFSSLANNYYIKIEVDPGSDLYFYWEDATHSYYLYEDLDPEVLTIEVNSGGAVTYYEGNVYDLDKSTASEGSVIIREKKLNEDSDLEEKAVYSRAEVRPITVK